jgi:hypothetical protein
MGTQEVTFTVGKKTFTHEFLVASLDTEYSGILGLTSSDIWEQESTYEPARFYEEGSYISCQGRRLGGTNQTVTNVADCRGRRNRA